MTSIRFVDRTNWPAGPWDDEPDREDWVHESGLPCFVLRHRRYGNWCGYVGVPEGHPLHGVHFMEAPVDAHGGLTYSDACWGEPPVGICHVPAEGEHDVRWWLGFDCNHAWDFAPGAGWADFQDEVYRTIAYARGETERLADQIAAT